MAKKLKEAVFTVLPEATDYKEVLRDGLIFYEGFDRVGRRVGVAIKANIMSLKEGEIKLCLN